MPHPLWKTILGDVIAIFLIVGAFVGYYFDDKVTAGFVLTLVAGYYFGKRASGNPYQK